MARMPDDLPEPGTEPPAPPPTPTPRGDQRPLWTAFLTPIAVFLGAWVIAGAIWLTNDDDPAPASPPPAPITDGAESTIPAATANLRDTFAGYARQLGMDEAKFQQCLSNSHAKVQLITAQFKEGQDLGVTGTPTFFVNNKMIVGAQPPEIFDEVIDKELSGSPATLDGYSDAVKQLAASGRFAIADERPDLANAPIEGNAQAKVVIAEFSDFQCPFCKRWSDQNLARIRERLGDDVAFAFLHFPLTQIHPNAGNASLAATCAEDQGKFWEMHDMLFARQNEWQGLPAN